MSRNALIKTLRLARWVAVSLIGAFLVGVVILELGSRSELTTEDSARSGISIPPDVSIGGPFHLTDDKGHPITDADYRGRWVLIYFGYTNCLDACPLALQKMAIALKDLGPLANQLAALFITVDPARDTPGRLASYLENFDPRIVGLTGNDQQIAAAAKAYHVYYSSSEPDKSGAYLVSHSSFFYLMDPSGRFNALLPLEIKADELRIVLRGKLGKKS
jgi:protein SCO1/2